MHAKSLAIRDRIYGDNHLDVAQSLNSIGTVLNKMGKPEEALVHLQKGLEIRLKLLGNEHLHVAASYHNLRSVYYSQGQYEQALEYFQKDLDITVRLVGTTWTWPKALTT